MTGFAQKHMKRYGWAEGKGLGRTENGMKDAIKVKLKNNMRGLGHDQGAEFTFHWWDHIFNKAASSFKVNESDEGALIEKCEGKKITPLLITNKRGISTRLANKSLLYGTFVKSGTYDSNNSVKSSGSLTDEDSSDESSDSDDEDDDDKKGLINDTLDKMFKKTGLTGHKAARHGHSLNGKLQRLQNQEDQQSLVSSKLKETDDKQGKTTKYTNLKGSDDIRDKTTKYTNLKGSDDIQDKTTKYTKLNESDDNQETIVCNNEKRKKKKKDHSHSTAVLEQDIVQTDNSGITVTKKKKKKHIETDLSQMKTCLGKFSSSITDITCKLMKKGKHKLEEADTISLLDDQPKKKKKKKKKRRKKYTHADR